MKRVLLIALLIAPTAWVVRRFIRQQVGHLDMPRPIVHVHPPINHVHIPSPPEQPTPVKLNWATRNRGWFEVGLLMMGAYIAWLGVQVAQQQADLLELQTAAQVEPYLPVFELERETEDDGDEILIIRNTADEAAEDIELRFYTLLSLVDGPEEAEDALFDNPLGRAGLSDLVADGDSASMDRLSSGHDIRLVSSGERFAAFIDRLDVALTVDENDSARHPLLTTVVTLEYRDVLDNQHTEHYLYANWEDSGEVHQVSGSTARDQRAALECATFYDVVLSLGSDQEPSPDAIEEYLSNWQEHADDMPAALAFVGC